VFVSPSRLDDQVTIRCDLVNAPEVLADEEVSRNRSMHVMGQGVRCFIYVIAPEGSLVPVWTYSLD